MQAVFHLSREEPALQRQTLAGASNLLDDESVDVTAVVVVANGGGLALLVESRSEVGDRVAALQERGVVFRACRNTMRGAGVAEADLLDGVTTVASAVGELTRLQAAGYAYLRP